MATSGSPSTVTFLSHSRQEHLKPFVTRLKRDLDTRTEGRYTVWLDIDDIPPGSDVRVCTGTALHNCKCLIVILTNCYITSKYTISELYSADADDKRIIPVIYESIDYQQSQRAMGVKYIVGGLEDVSFIEGVDDYDTSLDKLATILKEFAKEQEEKLKKDESEKQALSAQMAELKLTTPTAPFITPTQQVNIDTQNSIEDQSQDGGNDEGNPFRPGMRLEAVDRRFPYYVCVATIADVRGDEVKVHFDGWGPEYDYWCTYDMVELHPVGWCARNGYEMQKPRNLPFANWNKYLSDNQVEPCDAPMFNEIQNSPTGSLHFRVGMKVEAKDRKNPNLICVASIIDINKDNELLIHFDGWSEAYDYWCKPDTTDIHPPMWCSKHNRKVEPPHGHQGYFKWSEYLAIPANNPAPFIIFTEEQVGDL